MRMTLLMLVGATGVSAQRTPANIPIRPLGAVVQTSALTFQPF